MLTNVKTKPKTIIKYTINCDKRFSNIETSTLKTNFMGLIKIHAPSLLNPNTILFPYI